MARGHAAAADRLARKAQLPDLTAQVLADAAAEAGLARAVKPFPREGALAERLRAARLLMAPMAGVSDAAYRTMARAGGAALAYSEMVSVAGIHYGGAATWELVVPCAAERDLAVQLFGSDPAQFAEAAEQVSARLGERLALIDINMACPVPKVVRKGEGSALMDDPARAAAIVRAVRAHASVPVTVKIRQGRVAGTELAPDFARAMEQAGAAAIAVHGRYASQLYRGTADWDAIARVVAAVDVPVIASGDVYTPEVAEELLRRSGAAAAFVARGSYGNPWVFGAPAPSFEQKLAAFALHVRLLEATGAHLARARSLAGWYFRGFPMASSLRNQAMACSTADEFLGLAARVRDEIRA